MAELFCGIKLITYIFLSNVKKNIFCLIEIKFYWNGICDNLFSMLKISYFQLNKYLQD